jgi:hypothetical protein
MGNRTSIESVTWFDDIPMEIIYLIFKYLSTNDILYTFFDLNERLKIFLLENHCYTTYLELSITNFDKWRKIIPLISCRIECLHINTIYFLFPLNSFTNLKSIIISSSHGFADEELKSLVESEQFHRLESFRMISNHRSSTCYDNNDHYQILNEVFTNRTSLKIFEYSFVFPPLKFLHTDHYQINSKLESLKLILTDYEDIFVLLEYTPNLKYLNIHSKPLSRSIRLIKNFNLKLKQFDLKLSTNHSAESLIDFDQLMNNIKPFSSSLICLSLNIADLDIFNRNEIPFDFIKLQQWLQSMIKLKEFHFYGKLIGYFNLNKMISIELQNWYWLKYNLSFGMHEKYLYTLPFYFGYLHRFPNRFQITKSNNLEISINNSRLWSNVKSIELPITEQYDKNFICEIKMKLPNLSSIQFIGVCHVLTHETHISLTNNNESILDKLTTIDFTGLIERETEWLINSLPNLRYLIFSSRELSSLEFSLKSGQFRLPFQMENDLDSILKQLDEIHFSNIKHITISLNDSWTLSNHSANLLIKILKKSKDLQTFLIYISKNPKYDEIQLTEEKLHKFLDRLSKSRIKKHYEIKCFRRYCFIFKLNIR